MEQKGPVGHDSCPRIDGTTPNETFGKPADSGSFVFDNLGGVVGMLLTRFEVKETTYFTSLENIFRDIKEVGGAEEVRITY